MIIFKFMLFFVFVLFNFNSEAIKDSCSVDHMNNLLKVKEKNFYVKEKTIDGQSSEGGGLKFFYSLDKNILKFIKYVGYSHLGNIKINYFFDINKNYLVQTLKESYDRPINILSTPNVIFRNETIFPVCHNQNNKDMIFFAGGEKEYVSTIKLLKELLILEKK